ncbi:MAG: M50 family metallopeptidase [Beduini sp.]|uniref:M50 family metallopeptidase n=1 Tax=Beduini sp. TaxID=1922300 RepID=UPI0039903CC3
MQHILIFIVFILVLGFIITIHELGHFIAAKHFGVYCGQFSIGMGPKLWSKKIGETNYELRALPIGGFVAMAGEADQEENEDMKDVPFERTLKGIATWKQVVVYLAGVFMNFLSAFIIIVAVYAISVPVQSNSSTIGKVVDNSPAMTAGIQAEDTINKITVVDSGKQFLIGSYSDLQGALSKSQNNYSGETLALKVTIERDHTTFDYNVNATYRAETDSYFLGISPTTRRLTFVESVEYGANYFKEASLLVFSTLGKLITNSKETIGQLSGPVGIYNVVGEVTQSGNFANVLLLVSMLGINIGVFNLLPIPGLDGSQVLFAVVEKAIGRDIPVKFRYALQLAGLALVFGLMIIVTVNDITRLF